MERIRSCVRKIKAKIERAAFLGESRCEVQIDGDIPLETLLRTLKERGYDVEIHGRVLKISWS